MKKTIKCLFAAIVLIAAASCAKEIQSQTGNEPVMEGRVVVATFAANEDGTKTTIAGMSPRWSDGDQVYISDGWETGTGDCTHYTVLRLKSGPGVCSDTEGIIQDGGAAFKFIVPSSFGYPVYAVYPASALGAIYTEKREELPFKDVAAFEIPYGVNTDYLDDYPDGSFSSANICVAKVSEEGGNLSFKNVTSIIKIEGKTPLVKSVQISNDTQAIAGSFYYDFSTGNVEKVFPDEIQNIKSITTRKLTETGPYYIAVAPVTLPAGTEFLFKNKGPEEEGVATVGNKRTSAAKTLRRSKIYNIGYAMDGVLPGAFSVSDTKKVYFSKGNLYYTGSEWALEANQYDYRTWPGNNACIDGTQTANGTPSGNVGLFYWTSATEKSYLETYSETGTGPSDTFFANTDNSVIGSNWNALTKEEWSYLLHSRTNANSKIGYATVCGVQGVILLPDTFTDPMKNGGSGAFVPRSTIGFSANTYIKENWNAMESAGAVFLPASGYRVGKNLYSVGNQAYYWYATAHDNSVDAYSVHISSNSDFQNNFISRDSGVSIRLVTE